MQQVTAAVIINAGRIFIAKRKAGDTHGEKWEFPGGTIEDGESAEDCLKREMKEEFGIDVSIGEYLGESIYHYNNGSIRLMAYRTFWDSGDIVPKVHDEYQWVSKQELLNYFFAPADRPFVEKLRNGEIEV